MFNVPDGFRAVRAGRRLLLHLQNGEGTISYEDGLRAQGPAPELGLAWELPDGFTLDPTTIERGATREGELALLARGTGPFDGREVEVTIGFVFLDDTFVRIVGAGGDDVSTTRTRKATRDVLLGTRLFLGAPRRRRYLYEPPPWQPVASGWYTMWLAPHAPPGEVTLSIAPALPTRARPGVSLAAMLLDLPTAPAPLSRLRNRQGLDGHVWTHVVERPGAAPRRTLVVVLSDGTYDYGARLEAGLDAAPERALFERVMGSIQPLPRPHDASEQASCAMSFWTS